MELKSKLYSCKVVHDRKKPKKNFFSYNIFMFLIDLDELQQLSKQRWLIGYNKLNVFGFFDKDHFKNERKDEKNISVKHKLQQYLTANGIDSKAEKVMLLTHLRIFNHVFNPVSFYYCYDENRNLFAVVAEVTNTYGEMKMYLVDKKDGRHFTAVHQKHFYISPFTELDDFLKLKIGEPGQNLKVFIDDFDINEVKVKTILTGKQKRLTNLRLINYLLRFPFLTLQIISLIHWQALKLWLKGIRYIPKDANQHLQKDIYFRKKVKNNAEKILQKNSVKSIGKTPTRQTGVCNY